VCKSHILVFSNISSNLEATEVVLAAENHESDWPLSPEMLLWSSDGQNLYISAPDRGTQRIFEIGAIPGVLQIPSILSLHGSVSDMYRHSNSNSDKRLLVTSSSFTQSSIFFTFDLSSRTAQIISRLLDCERLNGKPNFRDTIPRSRQLQSSYMDCAAFLL